jgi:hypothetical protein
MAIHAGTPHPLASCQPIRPPLPACQLRLPMEPPPSCRTTKDAVSLVVGRVDSAAGLLLGLPFLSAMPLLHGATATAAWCMYGACMAYAARLGLPFLSAMPLLHGACMVFLSLVLCHCHCCMVHVWCMYGICSKALVARAPTKLSWPPSSGLQLRWSPKCVPCICVPIGLLAMVECACPRSRRVLWMRYVRAACCVCTSKAAHD